MSKAGVALAATGVGGTGAAAIATAHKLGAFESYGPHHIATT